MSLSTPSLCRFLYVSDLAPAMPSNVVGQILRQSRDMNHRLGVSGALLFDGERFCQLIEGECDAATALMQRIETDPRHHAVTNLLDTAITSSRVMTMWQCGYCNHGAFDEIEAAAAASSANAVMAFIRLLTVCDMST